VDKYFHSITLDKDKCKGCTNCIKGCPTEAIRVRNGKAKIIKERCIDCGECLRACPHHAKKATFDNLSMIENYKYKIALPAPTLYGQFKKIKSVDAVLAALLEIGFDSVFEVAKAADYITAATEKMIKDGDLKTPIISGACPAIVRLIKVRFPNLIENILPLLSPMDLSAKLARKEAMGLGYKDEEIGIFFISPCAAKVTAARSPLGLKETGINGVLSISDIYVKILPLVGKVDTSKFKSTATIKGIGWASRGGENSALDMDNSISVDGINNVIKVLEELEDEKLSDISFVEALSCTGGCVGGPVVAQNPFISQNKLKNLLKMHSPSEKELEINQKDAEFKNPIKYEPILKLDNDIVVAMQKMELLEKICEGLPGLDCGSCGAPTCKALAEDIVRGYAEEDDCIFKHRERLTALVEEVRALQTHIPPPFRKEE
jgi:iron only hydrogenase large subunit-like protein